MAGPHLDAVEASGLDEIEQPRDPRLHEASIEEDFPIQSDVQEQGWDVRIELLPADDQERGRHVQSILEQGPAKVSGAIEATRGRFAHLVGRPVHSVTIDADLYELFGSAEAINAALRAFVMIHEAAPRPPRAPRRPSKGRAA